MIEILLLLALFGGFVAGWACRRSEDGRYLERRARFLAQQMLMEALPAPRYGDVIDAEVVPAQAVRLDRLELTQ